MNTVLLVAALKVLAVGNSFSVCTQRELPQVAKAMGQELDLVTMTIGGCSFERHWNCCTNEADLSYSLAWNRGGKAGAAWPELERCKKETLRYDRRAKKKLPAKGANLAEVLKAAKWDVITVQQASHFSWQPETYRPWADDLCRKIRELAPTAEIVVQETWSYTPWDKRLAKWGIDQNEMYAKLHRAYADYAAAHGYRVIPTGTAVQLWRRQLPVKYAENSFGGDVCGSAKFVQGADGRWTPKGDVFHFNGDGTYLQALVWCAKLFNVDVTKCAYAPKGLDAAKADLMKKVARAAVNGESPVAQPAKEAK